MIEFTDAELRAIHAVVKTTPWLSARFYRDVLSAIEKLDDHFGPDDAHLRPIKVSEGGAAP